MEVQKHWPGLLPSAYPDPSLIYGVIQKKPADVRMPAILDTRKAQTAKQTYMNEIQHFDQYKLIDSYNNTRQRPFNAVQQSDNEGDTIGGGLQQFSSQDAGTAGAGQPMTSVQPSFQTTSQPQNHGIGPGGMDLTSFFINQSQLLKQSPRKTVGGGGVESTVGGGAIISSAEITNKLESEVNIQSYLIDQPNNNLLSKSQNFNQSAGNMGGQNEFSPDNTQFTILKAKLFNPQISQPQGLIGGNSIAGQAIQENSISTSHPSVLAGNNVLQSMSQLPYSKPQSQAVSAYLNHQKIDEHHTQIVQNFQKQYLTNQQQQQNSSSSQLLMPSLLGYKSLQSSAAATGGAMANPRQSFPQQTVQKGSVLSKPPTASNAQTQRGGGPHQQTTNNFNQTQGQRSQELGRQLKHKKDMQQLKFYQTLTSQAHVQQQQQQQQQNYGSTKTGKLISLTGAQGHNPLSLVNSANSLAATSGPQIMIPFNGNVVKGAPGGVYSMLSNQAGPTTINVSSTRTNNNPVYQFSNEITNNNVNQAQSQKGSPKHQRPIGAEQSALTNKSAIVVKDGDINAPSHIKSPKFKSSYQPQIQTGTQSLQSVTDKDNLRPQTSVNLDEQHPLLQEEEDLYYEKLDDQNNANSQGTNAQKIAGKTQRDFTKLTRGGGSNGSNLNDKSYTQNISEASRDDTMILKPQNILKNLLANGSLESQTNILPVDCQNPLLQTTQNRASTVTQNEGENMLAQQSQEYHIDKIKTTHSINRMNATNDNISKPGCELGSLKSQIEAQSSAAYGYNNNGSSHSGNNRRRQLLSIDSNNPQKKKNGFNETGDFGGNILLDPQSNYDLSKNNNLGNSGFASQNFTNPNMTAIHGFTGTAGYATLNNSVSENQHTQHMLEQKLKDMQQMSGGAIMQSPVMNHHNPQSEMNSSQLMLVQRQKNQFKHLKSQNLPPQVYGEGGLAARLQTAPHAQEQFEQLSSAASGVVKNNLIIKKCEMSQRAHLVIQNKISEQAGALKLPDAVKRKDNNLAITQSERENRQQTAVTEKSRVGGHGHACQRFLDRGNKPVPPNYEEQDVLPHIHEQQQVVKFQAPQPAFLALTNGQQQQLPYTSNQGNGFRQKTVGGKHINIDDFDDEINGINLSKLFSAYGPSSMLERDNLKMRKNRTQAGIRHKQHAGTTNLRKSLPGAFNQQQDEYEYEEGGNGYEEEDEDQDEVDFSGFDEPVVIRLMANMFSQKKVVQEVLPEIDLDKLRKEIYEAKLKQKAQVEKAKRDKSQWDWLKQAEYFLKKFSRYLVKQESMSEDANQVAIVELRANPFYVALRENRVEKERLEKIKEMQMVEYVDIKKREEMEEQLKNKAREQVNTDIFKHTFVDADNQPLQQLEEVSTDIMSRPAKDVFTFMNLNFELPSAYYQTFGDFNAPNEHQRMIIKDFMFSHWPQMRRKQVTLRVAYDSSKQVFNVILLGKNCPLSKCCKMTVCFQFDREIGGKVLCMETLCPYNPLDQFFMPSIDIIEELFRDTQPAENNNAAMPLPTDRNNNSFSDQAFQPSTQHPRLRRVMAMEVSKTIFKGLHKNGGSIREMLLKSNAVNSTFNELQLKQKNEMIAQLYSSEGALQVLKHTMQMNHPSNYYPQQQQQQQQLYSTGGGAHHPLFDEPIQEEVTIEDEVNQLSKRDAQLADQYEQLLLQDEDESLV